MGNPVTPEGGSVMRSDCRSVQRHLTTLAVTLAIGLMTGCSAAEPPRRDVGMRTIGEGTMIEGTATYRERIALPPNAVFEALLQDVTVADASATEIARTSIPGPTGPPIRFSIAFDPTRIDARRVYSVSARILVDGELMFTSDTAYPVLTGGAGHTVDIVLKMEGSGVERSVVVNRFINAWPHETCEPVQADAPLTDTYWRINSLDGHSVSAANALREPHLLLKRGDQHQTYAATIGCNQLAGGYTLAGENITFTQGVTTLMACPPPLDTLETRLGEVLARTRRWQIKGNTLEFMDQAGSRIALFEAVYL
jgi:putative lipoprotein